MRAPWLRRFVATAATAGIVGSLAVTGVVGGGVAPASAALPSGISLLADLGTGESGRAEYVVTLGDKAFVSGSDGTHDGSLFVSDGSGNNSLVKDINPDGDDGVTPLISNGSKVLFSANDGTHGIELWITDGTEANTKLLKDIITGSDSSYPGYPMLVGTTVYFFVYGSGAYDLWKTDGTSAGTVLVKAATTSDVYWGSGVSGKGYWMGNDPTYGRELWVTDGTDAGTKLVKDINPGSSSGFPLYPTVFGTKLAFIADDGAGKGLWVSDGTEAGTTRLYSSGSASFQMPGLTNANGTLYTGTLTYGGCITSNGSLIKSDGTVGGTSVVVDVPCSDSANTAGFGYFASIGSTAFFSHYTKDYGWELWKSDGTAGGTVLVKDIYSGSGGSSPDYWVKIGSKLLFGADTGSNPGDDYPMWVTDGTSAGTVELAPYGWHYNVDYNISAGSTQVFFASDDGAHGQELWVTKGTTASTKLTFDINKKGDSSPGNLTPLGSKALFTAESTDYGAELFITDGTAAGTSLVKDIRPGTSSSDPSGFAVVGSKALFPANDGTNGTELWVTDGTAANTKLLKDIRPGASGSSPSGLVTLGSSVLFYANDGTNGGELWISDGTAAGTSLLKDIRSGSGNSNPGGLRVAGSKVYFYADDGTNGVELWVTDGTAGGTSLLKDIQPGSGSSYPGQFTAAGASGFFTANDGTNGVELWFTDGTAGGTVLVKDIQSGSGNGLSSYAAYITVIGSTAYFAADDGTNGGELWKSNGTSAGTELVKDINPGSSGSYPYSITAVGSTLYLAADDGTHGQELWKSDGLGAGTALVKDIVVGSESGYIWNIANVGDALYFDTCTDAEGCELWTSDGTEADTDLVVDLWPGINSGSPDIPVQVGTNLVIAGETPDYGTELYAKSNKPLPVISFTPPEKLNANTTYSLSASSSNPARIKIDGNGKCGEHPGGKLRTKGVGTCVIIVSQAESGSFAPVSVSFEVTVVAPNVAVTFNKFVYPSKAPSFAAASVRPSAGVGPASITKLVALQAKTTPKQAGCVVTFVVRPNGGGDPIVTLEATSDDDGLATTEGINLPYATYDIDLTLGGDCLGTATPASAVVFNGIELPATGADILRLVWTALGLLAAGAALHFGRRLRATERAAR